MMTADNGVVTEWQSYLGNLAMVKGGGLEKYWTDSEVFRCRGGNQQLATKLVAAIGAAKVLTRTPVRSVDVTDNGARVALANGKMLEADHVILTAPPIDVEPDRVRSRRCRRPDAADGHQREVPDGPQRPVLAPRGAGAGSAQRRPGRT